MSGVAVVTDSAADLPRALAERLGIRVVPMSVAFGPEVLISGVSITPERFYERLGEASELPTTSQPSPAWFDEAYADAHDDALDAVVSIHVSSALSGTVALARSKAEAAPLPVEVVDSRTVGPGQALVTLAAHRAASDGAGVGEVVATAERVRAATSQWVVVDTLDYLRRGGRLTGAQAMMGSMLRVKPILGVVDGRVEVEDRARTWRRALQRVVGLVEEAAADRPVDVIVTHAVAPDRAEELWTAIGERVEIRDRLDALIGPIIGTHTGPGAVAVAVTPAPTLPAPD